MQRERCIEDGYRNSCKMTTIGNVYRNYCEEAKNAPLLFDPGVLEPLKPTPEMGIGRTFHCFQCIRWI